MTILIPEPVLIVICQCFCSLMDMQVPLECPNQPKTLYPAWYLWCEKAGTKKFSVIMKYDEYKDLAFCHLCMLIYRDRKLHSFNLDKTEGSK